MTKTTQAQSSKLHHTLAIIFATFFVTVSSGVMAQANGGDWSNGGVGSFTTDGGVGSVSYSGGYGGGSGINGGAGSAGAGTGGGAGGLGGIAPGGAGDPGLPGTDSGSGGGGGGGAAGKVVTSNFENTGTITGGAGGAAGAGLFSFRDGGTGFGGVGVGLVNNASLNNSGTILAGDVGAGFAAGVRVATLSSSSIINSGLIDGANVGFGIYIRGGTITNLTNTASGTIRAFDSDAIVLNDDDAANGAAITTLTNHGVISADGYGNTIATFGGTSIGILTNHGTISGVGTVVVYSGDRSEIGTFLNTESGIISNNNATGYGWVFRNYATYQAFTNNGTISSTQSGFENNDTGIFGTLTNTGTISVANGDGIYNAGSIGTLTNTGAISATNGYGISSFLGRPVDGWYEGDPGAPPSGTIGTLNNAQGGNSATPARTALTYAGVLPTNYNIIINSQTQYGQLAVTSGVGTTAFGIYAGGVSGVAASTLSKGTYASVLSGLTSSNLYGATSGNYNGFTWTLNNASETIWDLIVTGASNDDTQKSIVATAASLQNTLALQNAVLANSFGYDCTQFSSNGVCISAGGRNTTVQAGNGLNNTSALLIASYRPHPNYRIGAYADQNLSVKNVVSTLSFGNNTPLIGLFGAWNQRLNGTGAEIKVSAAYGQKNANVTRQVVGSSEPGSGSSQLNSQGAQISAKYGFAVNDKLIVSPYLGMRYTANNIGGYTEGSSTTVTAPLTFSALHTNATTALAGVGASYKMNPQVTAFASAGVETDTNAANGSYYGTNSSNTGLTPVNFNADPVKTRATAVLGAYYDVEKNQRFTITGIYRQESYQAVSTTTVLATYTLGWY